MSALSDARADIGAVLDGLSYDGEAVPFYDVEQKPGTAQGRRYLSLWNTATTDMHHVFELRLYVAPQLGLEGGQRELDDISEVVDAAIPLYMNVNAGWTLGWSEETGQLVAVWTLHLIRKQQHI